MARSATKKKNGRRTTSEEDLRLSSSLVRFSAEAPRNSPDHGFFGLLAAAAKSFEYKSFSELRVEDLCVEANVSRSTFYNHFENKKSLCAQLFIEYSRHTQRSIPLPEEQRHPYIEIRDMYVRYTRVVCANRKLHYQFVDLSGRFEEISEIWDRYALKLSQGTSARLAQHEAAPAASAITSIWPLGSLLHENVYAVYIAERTKFPRVFLQSPDELAELAAALTYRAIYLEDPPATLKKP